MGKPESLVQTAARRGRRQGEEDERAQIVGWIRAVGDAIEADPQAENPEEMAVSTAGVETCRQLANAIEAGKHRA